MRLFLLCIVIISVLSPGFVTANNKYQLFPILSETDLGQPFQATFWRNFKGHSFTLRSKQVKPTDFRLGSEIISEYPNLTPSNTSELPDIYGPDPESLTNIQFSSIKNRGMTKKPDFDGLLSDTKFYVGYQLGMVVIIFFLPTEISKWDKNAKTSNIFAKYWDNITNPVWDSDEWYINYIMHPYFGATYHVRARERGYGPMGGFYYSFLMSSLWEFGLEAFAEPVSIQDVIVTPFYGALVGEFFMRVRQNIKRKEPENRTAWNKFVLFMTDPIGSLNTFFRRWTGWTTHLEVEPFHGSPIRRNLVHSNTDRQFYGINNYDEGDRTFQNDINKLYSNSDIVGLNFKITW